MVNFGLVPLEVNVSESDKSADRFLGICDIADQVGGRYVKLQITSWGRDDVPPEERKKIAEAVELALSDLGYTIRHIPLI